MIRAADAAKERLVTGSCCRVNVGELLRGVANQLDKLGWDGAPVRIVVLVGRRCNRLCRRREAIAIVKVKVKVNNRVADAVFRS